MQDEIDWKVRWTAYPLHPDTPQAGLTLEELFGEDAPKIPKMKARWAKVARQVGLPFGDRTHSFNSRHAQELSKWAETRGAGMAFHMAVYRACFVGGENIAKTDVLLDLVASAGLPAAEAKRVLEKHLFREAVDADWKR